MHNIEHYDHLSQHLLLTFVLLQSYLLLHPYQMWLCKILYLSQLLLHRTLRIHLLSENKGPEFTQTQRPSSQWYHPAISSSVILFSSCPQSLPASESFPMSQLFAWGSQSIEVSASASVLPMNTQDWSPLGLTGWISLESKGLSRVFSNTTVQKHQFFSAQLSI